MQKQRLKKHTLHYSNLYKINDIMKLNEYIEITNEDNMELMARYPDKYFDLCIVDPPYGLDFTKYNRVQRATDGTTYISNNYK